MIPLRYLVNRETLKSVAVDDDDEKKFRELLTERGKDGRQLYEQTGPQDPNVSQIEVPGESHGTSPLAPAREGDEAGGTQQRLERTAKTTARTNKAVEAASKAKS